MSKITSLILTLIAVISINTKISAQSVVVSESTENIGGAVNPVYTFFVDGVEFKKVTKAWRTYFEDHKGKIETSKNDWTISNAIFPVLSANPIAVLSRVIEDKSGTRIIVAFNKDGQFVNSAKLPAESDAIKKMLYDFAISVKKAAIQEKLDDASKELAKLESKGKDLVSKKESLDKDIVNYNDKIKQAEKDIQENLKDQADNISKTEAQSKVVEDLKSAISNLK